MDTQKILADPIVQKIIRAININCTDKDSHRDCYDFLRKICTINNDGVTKTVFLHDNWDFVIKVSNYHRYPSRNYCELEKQHYQSAKQFRVERVLLETEVLTQLSNGITLYVQPRYDENNSSYSWDIQKRRRLEKKLNNQARSCPTGKAHGGMYEAYRIDRTWFCRVVQLYGKKFARALEAWSHANKIGDLHGSNIGWYQNRPVILDYAGYYGEEYYNY